MKIKLSLLLSIFLYQCVFSQNNNNSSTPYGWAFGVGGEYVHHPQSNPEPEQDYSVQFTISNFTPDSRFNMIHHADYYQYLEKYDELFAGSYRMNTRYFLDLLKNWSIGGEVAFETVKRNRDFGRPQLETFAAFNSVLQYRMFPSYEDQTDVNISFGFGPHYMFIRERYGHEIFYNLKLEAYKAYKRLAFSLSGELNQSFGQLENMQYSIKPKLIVSVFDQLQINAGVLYRDIKTSENPYNPAYKTRVYLTDYRNLELEGYIMTFYFGLNYHFGAKNNTFVQNRY